MTRILLSLAVAAVAAGGAVPALAATSGVDVNTLTCAGFQAMTSGDQKAAVDAMQMETVAAHMDKDLMADSDVAMGDHGAEDMGASDQMQAENMAVMKANEDKDLHQAPAMTLVKACDGTPDKLAMDVLSSALPKM